MSETNCSAPPPRPKMKIEPNDIAKALYLHQICEVALKACAWDMKHVEYYIKGYLRAKEESNAAI